MLNIFIGYDHRQPISYQVLSYSLLKYATVPISITPLCLPTLELKRTGLTPFTFSRFLVPKLMDYKGWGLFLDADMIVTDCISKLFALKDDKYKVMVVKGSKKFEWASVMLFNCSKCNDLTSSFVEETDNLHGISWAKDNELGKLPTKWNFLVGYDEMNEKETPSLIHYTQGVPCFPETFCSDYCDEWIGLHREMNSAKPWVSLMGNSVHRVDIGGKAFPRFMVDEEKKAPKEKYLDVIKRLIKGA